MQWRIQNLVEALAWFCDRDWIWVHLPRLKENKNGKCLDSSEILQSPCLYGHTVYKYWGGGGGGEL